VSHFYSGNTLWWSIRPKHVVFLCFNILTDNTESVSYLLNQHITCVRLNRYIVGRHIQHYAILYNGFIDLWLALQELARDIHCLTDNLYIPINSTGHDATLYSSTTTLIKKFGFYFLTQRNSWFNPYCVYVSQ
jgi:predicted  nucleic acid-binding Zn ribbon protein